MTIQYEMKYRVSGRNDRFVPGRKSRFFVKCYLHGKKLILNHVAANDICKWHEQQRTNGDRRAFRARAYKFPSLGLLIQSSHWRIVQETLSRWSQGRSFCIVFNVVLNAAIVCLVVHRVHKFISSLPAVHSSLLRKGKKHKHVPPSYRAEKIPK